MFAEWVTLASCAVFETDGDMPVSEGSAVSEMVRNLARSPLFSGLSTTALGSVAARSLRKDLAPGKLVVLQGDECQAVYLVIEGVLRARRTSEDGREQVLSYLGSGALYNLVSALDGGSTEATLEAVTAATVYAVPCQAVAELMSQEPQVAIAVARYLATEVRRLTDMVESLALHTVRRRLARFLLDSADGRIAARRWTQQEIAAHLGTVREMVGRSMRAFVEAGLVRREGGKILLLDRDGLEVEANGGG